MTKEEFEQTQVVLKRFEHYTNDMIDLALEKTCKLIARYKKNGDSIREGEGIFAAKIAEIAITSYYGLNLIDTYDYDLFEDRSGKKIEVKAKVRNVRPEYDFNATVCCKNTRQACDYYLFCSAFNIGNRDCEIIDEVAIVGVMPRQKFLDESILYEKGHRDPKSRVPFYFKEDCLNIEHHLLEPVSSVIGLSRG